MPAKKVLTQKQIISKISNFDWFKKGNVTEIVKFRKDQGEAINKLIENKQFSKSDFDILTDAFNYFEELLTYTTCVDEDKIELDGLKFNKEEFMQVFINICKSYITLLVQFNVKFDKYLKYFNPESSYYKKMKALSLIRWFNGSKKEVGGLFNNVSVLLGSAIELDPMIYESCCKLGIECMDLVFGTNWSDPTSNNIEDNLEKIKFICENGDFKFVKAIKNSEAFHKWFYAGLNFYSYDERISSSEGVNKVIKDILKEWNINGENELKIIDLMKPNFDKYYEKEKILDDIEFKYKESFDLYLKKFIGSNNEIPSIYHNHVGLIWSIISTQEVIYGKERNILKCDIEESKDIIGFMNQHIGCYDINKNKVIIGCTFDISKEESNKILKTLKGNYSYEFKVCKLDDELILLYKMLNIDNEERDIKNKLTNIAYDLYRNAYECINKLNITFPKNTIQGNNDVDYKYNDYNDNNNRKPNLDKERINKARKDLSELDSAIDGYKKTIDRQFSEVVELKKEINSLKELLKENGIKIEKDSELSENLIEKRNKYRITVIGGSPKTLKGYKNLGKNNEFIDKLENIYHLKRKQFELKGDYNKQHDKKFAKDIENELLIGSTNFIIVLQTDHKTALYNLINGGMYKSQITYFGELENGKVTGIGQDFSYDKFDHYLELALEKYERKTENDLIGLK